VSPESLALAEQKEFLTQLCAIADLQFDTLTPTLQLTLMRSMQVLDVTAGDVLIREGDEDDLKGAFYFILGPKDAQVEVVRQIDGREEFLTRINAGQYFGEKFFITNRAVR
jgi:CRP-like cAMP-binding protein